MVHYKNFTMTQHNQSTLNNRHQFSVTAQSVTNDDILVPNHSQPLGSPLPTDEHACSVSLPTWSSVVGYEEGDATITTMLKCGYPRFVYHPYVLQLMDEIVRQFSKIDSKDGKYAEDCLVLPSKVAALRCQKFLQIALQEIKIDDALDNALVTSIQIDDKDLMNDTNSDSRIRVVELVSTNESELNESENTVYAVLFPATTAAGMQAKAYWQHSGEVCSSRRAELLLTNLKKQVRERITDTCSAHNSAFSDGKLADVEKNNNVRVGNVSSSDSIVRFDMSPHDQLRNSIAQWAGVDDPDYVFLTPSGMSSIYDALRTCRRYHLLTNSNVNNGGTSIVFGFPYLDTLKLCSRPEFSPGGVEFFGHGCRNDLETLEKLCKNSPQHLYSGLFTEVPSNPLLQCPDLIALRRLADRYNFCLIIDDTISNFLNIDVITTGIADAVCTSLTKIVSGRGDAMAGSIVCNPFTTKGRWMQSDLFASQRQSLSNGLHTSDARAILNNSINFKERNNMINLNAVRLAEWLNSDDCPDVDNVYYPKINETSVHHFESVMRPNGGYGGLLSITFHSHMCQRHFYDALNVAKGPSLGTNFTLVCPYTLLAHYHELDFAMGYNVPPNLLRISVGLEPFEMLQEKFFHAMKSSRLYPQPKKSAKSKIAVETFFGNTTRGFQKRSFTSVPDIRKWSQVKPSSAILSARNLFSCVKYLK